MGIISVSGQIGRDDVHVISGADCLFLLLNLHPVDVRDLSLNQLDGLRLIQGLDMNVDDQALIHIQEIGQHLVRQLRSQDLQVGRRTHSLSHGEHLAALKDEAGRGHIILGGQAGLHQLIVGKPEGVLCLRIEGLVEDLQPFLAVQWIGRDPQDLEVIQNIGLDPLQTRLGFLIGVRLDGKCDVLGPYKAVVPLGQLGLQHLGVFGAYVIKGIVLGLDPDHLLILRHAALVIDKRELHMDAAVEVVEEIAPALENRALVLVLRQLVIDVIETDRPGISVLLPPAGPVLCHLSVGDGVLGGNLFFLRLLFFLFLLFSPSPFFLFLQLCLSVGSGLIAPAPEGTFLTSCHLFAVFFFFLKPPHSGDLLSISMFLLFLFLFLC